jgi:transposase
VQPVDRQRQLLLRRISLCRSRGGLSTKMHALVDALGNPRRFLLAPGQAHDDLAGADAMLPHMTANLLIADRAFAVDSRVLDPLAAAGKSAVIPPRPNRLMPREFNRELYKERHMIENFFCKLKPGDCHPLRQNRQEFPCRHPPRCRYDLAQLTTRPSVARTLPIEITCIPRGHGHLGVLHLSDRRRIGIRARIPASRKGQPIA